MKIIVVLLLVCGYVRGFIKVEEDFSRSLACVEKALDSVSSKDPAVDDAASHCFSEMKMESDESIGADSRRRADNLFGDRIVKISTKVSEMIKSKDEEAFEEEGTETDAMLKESDVKQNTFFDDDGFENPVQSQVTDNDEELLVEKELDDGVGKRDPSWFSRRRRRRRTCTSPLVKNGRRCSMDGCSTGPFKKVYYKEEFKEPCNQHDCCYQFKTCSRYLCDKAFQDRMFKKCDSLGLNWFKRQGCKLMARIYYQFVRGFGASSYGKLHGK